MHPVEQCIYLSSSFLPLVFTLHPVHFLYAKIRAEFSPAPGHSGFSTHGGSQLHYIHHVSDYPPSSLSTLPRALLSLELSTV